MSKSSKTGSIKEGLEQVRQEVDKWPSWMKTNETKETIRQSVDSSQGSGGQSCSSGSVRKS